MSRAGAGKLMKGLGYDVHAWMMVKEIANGIE